jgi:hypothetical protein
MRGVRRIVSLGILASCLSLVLPAATSARVVPLNWRERAPNRGTLVMSISVRTIVIEKRSWAVGASFTNRSRVALGLVPASGLALYHSRTAAHPYRSYSASEFHLRFPRRLGPGKSWSGEFGGFGAVKDGDYLRVIIGSFVGHIPRPVGPRFSWITDHAYRYSVIEGI